VSQNPNEPASEHDQAPPSGRRLNLVEGNFIGTDPTGKIAIGNEGYGDVDLAQGASNDTIGGTTAAAAVSGSGTPGDGNGSATGSGCAVEAGTSGSAAGSRRSDPMVGTTMMDGAGTDGTAKPAELTVAVITTAGGGATATNRTTPGVATPCTGGAGATTGTASPGSAANVDVDSIAGVWVGSATVAAVGPGSGSGNARSTTVRGSATSGVLASCSSSRTGPDAAVGTAPRASVSSNAASPHRNTGGPKSEYGKVDMPKAARAR